MHWIGKGFPLPDFYEQLCAFRATINIMRPEGSARSMMTPLATGILDAAKAWGKQEDNQTLLLIRVP